MTKRAAPGTRASLIERAADLYDYRQLFAQPMPVVEVEIPDAMAAAEPPAPKARDVVMQSVAPAWVPFSPTPFPLRGKGPATVN